MATFMVGNPEAEHAGYTTEDHYRWICDRCFQDFRELFGWTVKAELTWHGGSAGRRLVVQAAGAR